MSATVHFKGQPVTVQGHFPQPGETAPAFTLTNKELQDVPLSQFDGQRKILNIFPSVDTGVCAASVRHFNQLAGQLNNTVALCISADLPFAQARFCGAEGLDQVKMLSCFRQPAFREQYGVAISDGPLNGLAARAVIVLDEHNRVLHSELVSDIAEEPDYEAALAALK